MLLAQECNGANNVEKSEQTKINVEQKKISLHSKKRYIVHANHSSIKLMNKMQREQQQVRNRNNIRPMIRKLNAKFQLDNAMDNGYIHSSELRSTSACAFA